MATKDLHIHLLGDFRLTDGDELITAVNSPRMQSLLAYLLLHRGAPQPRYHLAYLLWPDSPEAQARSNLRNLLHRLLHAFPAIEDFLQEDNRDLCWRTDGGYTFDVADFEHALDQAKQAEAAGDPDAVCGALERVVGLYTGDLLPSCYDEWILQDRELMRQAFLDALERLSSVQEEQRRYRQAIASAQRLLRYDPLHEAIYRRLMQLYMLCGDRTGALSVYHTCAAVLKRELDIEPDVATRAIYQTLLVAEPQPEAQPAARAELVPKNTRNLPDALTSFVGREREIAAVKQLLATSRLLTLTGPLGSGKTRLALEVAHHLSMEEAFPDGVWWVELASITDPALAPQAVASVLGIREKPGEVLTRSIIEALRNRSLLLLMDNCEHLITECSGFAANLLRSCPNLRILATSREPLCIMGEVAWPVPVLAYPDGAEGREKAGAARSRMPASESAELIQYESVSLFVERAAAVLPTFQLTDRNSAAVAQICRRLEGIPLAIELAAARVKMMSVEQIAARLDDALHLLKANWGGELPHHKTLQAAIDWSYDLLSKKEQVLLRRFSVFSGGFTLEAAEQIAGFPESICAADASKCLSPAEVLDLLSHLIDKSLVVVTEGEQGDEVRYRLLEVVRQYARERLIEAAELEPAQEWHANFFLKLAEEAAPRLRSPEQETLLNRLEREHDNFRAALAWSTSHPEGAETGLRLVAGLWEYWDIRGYFNEGRRWLEEILAKATGRTIARARVLKAAGALAWAQSDFASARALLSESLSIHKEFGNQRDIGAGLLNVATVAISQGDYDAARPLLEEGLAIFREMGHREGIAYAQNTLATWDSDLGDYASARARLEESLALRRELGDKRGVAVVVGNLGGVAYRQGDYQAARPFIKESLDLYREVGDRRGEATSLNELGRVAHQLGECSLSYQLLTQSLAIWQELENLEGIAVFLEGAAGLASAWCDYERAVRLLAAAEALRERIGAPICLADQLDYDCILNRLRATLREDRLVALWAEGRITSMETAINLAVSSQLQPGCEGW